MLHISPLPYGQLKFFLEACGFRVERPAKDRLKPRQLLLYPLALAIRLAGWLRGPRGREEYRLDEVNSGAILMGGNTLIILARLSEGGVCRHDAPGAAACGGCP